MGGFLLSSDENYQNLIKELDQGTKSRIVAQKTVSITTVFAKSKGNINAVTRI